MLDNLGQGAGVKCDYRRARSQGLHRDQRTGFLDRARDEERTGLSEKFALLSQTDRPNEPSVGVQAGTNLLTKVLVMISEREHLSRKYHFAIGFAGSVEGEMKPFF